MSPAAARASLLRLRLNEKPMIGAVRCPGHRNNRGAIQNRVDHGVTGRAHELKVSANQ